MRIKIDTFTNPLSAVRGIGSYNQMLKEAIGRYGGELDLKLVTEEAEVELITDFNLYRRIKVNRGVSQIVVIHDLIPLKHKAHFPVGIRGKLCSRYNRFLLKKMRGIITDSQVVKNELIQLLELNPVQIEVVYPAAKQIFESAQKPSAPKFINRLPKEFVLYTGDVTWNKNLPRLAKAIKQLNFPLVLAGTALVNRQSLSHPWQQSYREFLKEVDKDKRFIFLGYVSDKELLWLYQQAKLLALPSLAEGFGLTWLEASWQKTPVVVGQHPVSWEIAGTAAVYADPLSVEKISLALKKTWQADNKELTRKQQERVKRYTQKRFALSLKTALHNLL